MGLSISEPKKLIYKHIGDGIITVEQIEQILPIIPCVTFTSDKYKDDLTIQFSVTKERNSEKDKENYSTTEIPFDKIKITIDDYDNLENNTSVIEHYIESRDCIDIECNSKDKHMIIQVYKSSTNNWEEIELKFKDVYFREIFIECINKFFDLQNKDTKTKVHARIKDISTT
jgi:hypothetical protein